MNIQYNEYMPTKEQLKAWILNKMKRKRFIGGRHTNIKNIRKGAPPKFFEEIDSILGELIKKGVVLVKITEYGKHVSLNSRAMKEIDEFVKIHFTEEVFK